jgi:hypothetical protein
LAAIGSPLQVRKLNEIEIMIQMFNKVKGGNYHEYRANHSHRRIGPIVRRGWRLLLE